MLWWLAQNTLIAAVLALAVSLANRWGRFSPAVRHALWLVAFVKLITPPLTCYSLPLAERWQRTQVFGQDPGEAVPHGPTAGAALTENVASTCGDGPADDGDSRSASTDPKYADALAITCNEVDDDVEHGDDQAPDLPATRKREVSTEFESQPMPALAWPIHKRASRGEANVTQHAVADSTFDRFRRLAFWGWILGTAGMIGLQSMRLLRFRRILGRSLPAPSWLAALVERSAASIGVAAPRASVTSERCSPLVCIMGRPNLLWPASLTARLTGDSRRAVIVHELAHLRRRDHWVGWLELLASCLWWWNPLFWFIRRQLRENAELACDAWVVWLLPQGRRAYAQALIEVSQFVSWTPAPVPAVGMGSNARRSFERRLTMILRERISCRAPLFGLALIVVLGLGVLPGWTQTPLAAPSDEKPDAAPELPLPGSLTAPENLTPNNAAVGSTLPLAGSAPEQAAPPDDVGPLVGPTTPSIEAPQDRYAGADKAPAPQNEARLEQLEARLAQLLDEVRTLRGHPAMVKGASNDIARGDLPAGASNRVHAKSPALVASAASNAVAGKSHLPNGVEVQNLTRARYRLALETAEALAAFVQQHVKADVDVKVVDADNVAEAFVGKDNIADLADVAGATLIVTASGEDQARIGAFIELLAPAGA
ncbi:MAG TPA: M56 family metallopeptidase, partial [Pirellulales bacterium]|nr:M56 family metallopeptidase [Pirellulales bacterium]